MSEEEEKPTNVPESVEETQEPVKPKRGRPTLEMIEERKCRLLAQGIPEEHIDTLGRIKGTGRPLGAKERPRAAHSRKLGKILELATKNVPVADIAKATHIPASTVKHSIKRYSKIFKEIQNVPEYESSKHKFLSAAEMTCLKSLMDPKKQKAATLNNVAYAFRQVYDANRLQRGLSTSNLRSEMVQFTVVSLQDFKPKDSED